MCGPIPVRGFQLVSDMIEVLGAWKMLWIIAEYRLVGPYGTTHGLYGFFVLLWVVRE